MYSSQIITTIFLSTSKNPAVAEIFCDKGIPNPATHSFFCIYEIVNDDRTALDISKISEFETEDEVLTARPLEIVGTRLLHNTSDILSQEDDSGRPRSNTMPVLDTYF